MGASDGFAADNSARARRLLVAKWRTMTTTDRVNAVEALHRDCHALAVAGIRRTEPHATPERVRYLLAMRRYGSNLAGEVYGSPSP